MVFKVAWQQSHFVKQGTDTTMAASSGHADSGSNESNAKSDRPAQVLIAARYRDQSRQPPQPAALPAKKKKKKKDKSKNKSREKRKKRKSPLQRRDLPSQTQDGSRSKSPQPQPQQPDNETSLLDRQREAASSSRDPSPTYRPGPDDPDDEQRRGGHPAAVDLDLRSRSARLRIVVPERIPPRPPPPRPRGERRPRSPDQPPSSDWRSYSPPGSSAPPESEAAASWRGYSPPRPTGAPPNQCPICGTVLRASGGPRAVDAALAAHQANSTKCLAKGKGKAYRRPRCPRCNKAIADNDWAREQHSWHCTGWLSRVLLRANAATHSPWALRFFGEGCSYLLAGAASSAVRSFSYSFARPDRPIVCLFKKCAGQGGNCCLLK